MSEQQTKRGKFKKVNLEGKTLEEFAEKYAADNGLKKIGITYGRSLTF